MIRPEITAAGECLTDGYRTLYGLDGTTIEDAAQAAWTPTGPPLDVLIDSIRTRRRQTAAA